MASEDILKKAVADPVLEMAQRILDMRDGKAPPLFPRVEGPRSVTIRYGVWEDDLFALATAALQNNTRTVPAATDTGLETVRYEIIEMRPSGTIVWQCAEHEHHANEISRGTQYPSVVNALCRRSRAEELLATKDAAIRRWRSECERAQSQNVELAEQLAKAEADVSRWHQKAMDAGVITHSDGTTSHPMRKERDDLKADNSEKDREIGQLKAALGADAAQFMQSLVDECSREIEKRKALEAKLAAAEKALEPFANAADGRKSKSVTGSVCFSQHYLLAARAVLGGKPS